jgi:hypothetical protein
MRSRSPIAPRYETMSPAVSWTRKRTGLSQARPERFAQAMKGCQGGPAKGKSALPPRSQAMRPMTRRDQRSSGSGAPSANSG